MPQLSPLAPAFCAAARGEEPGGPKPAGSSGSADACAAEAVRALDAYDGLVTRLSLPDQVHQSVSSVVSHCKVRNCIRVFNHSFHVA